MKKPLSFCTAVEASLTSGTESGEKQNESSLQGKKTFGERLYSRQELPLKIVFFSQQTRYAMHADTSYLGTVECRFRFKQAKN
jgi:hypothetical protein